MSSPISQDSLVPTPSYDNILASHYHWHPYHNYYHYLSSTHQYHTAGVSRALSPETHLYHVQQPSNCCWSCHWDVPPQRYRRRDRWGWGFILQRSGREASGSTIRWIQVVVVSWVYPSIYHLCPYPHADFHQRLLYHCHGRSCRWNSYQSTLFLERKTP